MEHPDVAKGLISALLGVEVVELTAQPQEITDQQSMIIGGPHGNLRVFRIDFFTVLGLRDGSEKRVLIELQKAGKLNSIDRFREYLGQHYARPASPNATNARRRKKSVARKRSRSTGRPNSVARRKRRSLS
jgi:hypothetical protein